MVALRILPKPSDNADRPYLISHLSMIARAVLSNRFAMIRYLAHVYLPHFAFNAALVASKCDDKSASLMPFLWASPCDTKLTPECWQTNDFSLILLFLVPEESVHYDFHT